MTAKSKYKDTRIKNGLSFARLRICMHLHTDVHSLWLEKKEPAFGEGTSLFPPSQAKAQI